jgi:hypothetical protein
MSVNWLCLDEIADRILVIHLVKGVDNTPNFRTFHNKPVKIWLIEDEQTITYVFSKYLYCEKDAEQLWQTLKGDYIRTISEQVVLDLTLIDVLWHDFQILFHYDKKSKMFVSNDDYNKTHVDKPISLAQVLATMYLSNYNIYDWKKIILTFGEQVKDIHPHFTYLAEMQCMGCLDSQSDDEDDDENEGKDKNTRAQSQARYNDILTSYRLF